MTEWTKITLRLPEQVHTALVRAANERRSSLNQIIVDRLNRSLGGVYVSEAEANDGTILHRLMALEQRLDKLEGHDSEMTEKQFVSKTQGEVLRDLKSRIVTDRK